MTSYSGPESEMWNDVEQWQEKTKSYNHPNIMTLHGFHVQRLTKFVPSLEIRLFMDMPLKSMIYHEKLTQKQPLSDDEIWFLLDCMLEALAHLQSQKTYVEFLSMETIYKVMTPFKMEVYKLAERAIKPSSQSALSIMIDRGNDYDFIKEFKKNLFLTPIQLDNIKAKNKVSSGLHDC